MSNLYRAGLRRMSKGKIFWVSLASMLVLCLYCCFATKYEMILYDNQYMLEDVFFLPLNFLTFLLPVSYSLFLSAEYHDGALRNKLVVGHSRNGIYLSNFLICATMGITLWFAAICFMCIIGIPLFGMWNDTGLFIMGILTAFFMILAVTALYTLICMLGSHRTVAVTCVLCAILGMYMAFQMYDALDEPEYYEYLVLDAQENDESMNMDASENDESELEENDAEFPVGVNLTENLGFHFETEKNPGYLTGTKRQIFRLIYDVLPWGQTAQLNGGSGGDIGETKMDLLIGYSCIWILAGNLLGMFFFRRKNIR